MSSNLLEALVTIIAESDNEIGGIFSTRLTATVAKGVTTLPVESTAGWNSTGFCSIDGVRYAYTSTSATAIAGISYIENEVAIPGTKQQHIARSEVVDVSQARSALDLLRRSMLVDYAEGEDLNTLGRNYGVLRLPFLADDNRYRKVIKALAYNPRGTIYGLELALDGLVDPGNYEIFEDLVNHPCKVFIRLSGSATQDTLSRGKTYLPGMRARPLPAGQQITFDKPYQTIQSIRWADDVHTSVTTVDPATEQHAEYEGETPKAVWVKTGPAPTFYGGYLEIANADALYYDHAARIQPESKVFINIFGSLAGTPSAVDPRDAALLLRDTERWLGLGAIQTDGTHVGFGLANLEAGLFIAGTPYVCLKGEDHEFELRKDARGDVLFFVDGVEQQRALYTLFPANATGNSIRFGKLTALATTPSFRIKRVSYSSITKTDYWGVRGFGGQVDGAAPSVFEIDIPGMIVGADVGKRVRISGGTAQNAQHGLNNGDYDVVSVAGNHDVTLQGRVYEGAELQNPKRIITDLPEAFRFPDDLGKKVIISGSGLGNDGTYVIDKLLDPDTDVDYETWLSHQPATTNKCDVVAAAFNPESGVSWRLDPAFVTEANLTWEMVGAGDAAANLLTLRQALPVLNPESVRVLMVRYTDVYSGQVLPGASTLNVLIDATPTYEFYPFYVYDPLGYVRAYLTDLLAAGVIPDFRYV